ncbi:MAG: hypothetical protein II896_03375 [Clostridia bacterium]|nr:hypothetical protein [Clostridia bacterium]
MIIAKVIKIIDEYQVVINKGIKAGVKKGDRFLVYKIGEEMKDPDTNESLGNLEIVCGEAVAKHVQDKMTTLESDLYESSATKRIIQKGGYTSLLGSQIEEIENPRQIRKPLKEISTECVVKQIS